MASGARAVPGSHHHRMCRALGVSRAVLHLGGCCEPRSYPDGAKARAPTVSPAFGKLAALWRCTQPIRLGVDKVALHMVLRHPELMAPAVAAVVVVLIFAGASFFFAL